MATKKPAAKIDSKPKTRVEELRDRKSSETALLDLSTKIHELQSAQAAADPAANTKAIAASVEKGLKSAVESLKSEDKIIRKQALNSLRVSRKQIDALDENVLANKKDIVHGLDAVLASADKNNSVLVKMTEDVSERFKKSMPTIKGFLGAFIKDQNPILSVGINLAKDVKDYYQKSSEDAKKDDAKALDEAAKQLKVSEELKTKVVDQTKLTEKVAEDAAKEAKKEKKAPASKKGEGPLVSRMDLTLKATEHQTTILQTIQATLNGQLTDAVLLIAQEVESLNQTMQILGDDGSLNRPTTAKEEGPKIIAQKKEDDPMFVLADKQSNTLERIETQIKELNIFMREKVKDDAAAAFKESEKEAKPVLEDKSGALLKKEPEGGVVGFLKSFTGNIGAMLGSIVAGLSSMLGPILKIVTKGGLLKTILRGSGILTAVFAAFDFIAGWNGASEMLDKPEEALNAWDKFSAGVGSVAQGLLGSVDKLGGFLGFEEGWSEGVGKKIAVFLSDLGDSVATMLQGAWTYVTDTASELMSPEFWRDKLNKAMSFVQEIPTMILDFFKSIIRMQLSFVPKALIPDWLDSALQPSSGKKSEGSAVPSPAPAKVQTPGVYKEEKAAAEKEKSGGSGSAPTIIAPSSSTVNSPTNNYYPSSLKTRNDDSSLGEFKSSRW